VDPFDVHIAWSPTSLDTDSMTTSTFITSQYQTVSRFGAKNSRRLAIIYYLLSLNSISIYKPRVPHPINIMYVNQTSLPEGQLWLVSRAIHSHTHISLIAPTLPIHQEVLGTALLLQPPLSTAHSLRTRIGSRLAPLSGAHWLVF